MSKQRIDDLDMISRQAALDEAFEVDTREYGRIEVVGVDAIDSLPPVTPQQKTGRWIDEGIYADGCNAHAYRCSECGYHVIRYIYEKPNYCEECGMKAEEEE